MLGIWMIVRDQARFNIAVVLDHRRRRWPNTTTTLDQGVLLSFLLALLIELFL